jgi:type IV secretion system protein VirD4
MRAMKNYAGHRLSPWLGHLMVSRQETARPLLTPGEVMQLPPSDELVLVSGCPPIRAKKARYYEDIRLAERILPPARAISHRPGFAPTDDWSRLPAPSAVDPSAKSIVSSCKAQIGDLANAGIRREPELPQHEEVVREPAKATPEFAFGEEESAVRAQGVRQRALSLARQAAMDPGDGLKLSE